MKGLGMKKRLTRNGRLILPNEPSLRFDLLLIKSIRLLRADALLR